MPLFNALKQGGHPRSGVGQQRKKQRLPAAERREAAFQQKQGVVLSHRLKAAPGGGVGERSEPQPDLPVGCRNERGEHLLQTLALPTEDVQAEQATVFLRGDDGYLP